MITISKISPSNIHLFQSIYEKRTTSIFHQEQVSNPNLHCFVIHDNMDSFGWISVVEVPKIGITDRVYYIDELYVHPSYRNNGYATELLKHVTTRFQHKELRLYVETTNTVAIACYQAAGFNPINQAHYMIRSMDSKTDKS